MIPLICVLSISILNYFLLRALGACRRTLRNHNKDMVTAAVRIHRLTTGISDSDARTFYKHMNLTPVEYMECVLDMINTKWKYNELLGDPSVVYTADADFLRLVQEELARARCKFVEPQNLLAALCEETGEVAKACMDEPIKDVIKECVQVAAVACRLAGEGDTSINISRKRNNLELFK
jgi:NTP pyrophosphatase (non-canonical NTP hydrolase)